MAEYNDVIKQFKRMCGYYNKTTQTDCPLRCKGHDGCNISDCRKLAFDDKNFQNVVMTWAEAHKEPVYPLWGDWLAEQGVVIKDKIGENKYKYNTLRKVSTPIPADIAEKLGIVPKEG